MAANVRLHGKKSAIKIERFLGVQEPIEIRFLGQIADSLILGHAHRRLVENQGFPGCREQQPQKELDGGRLARSIRPQKAEDLALADFQIQGVQGRFLLPAPKVSIDLGQLAGLNNYVLGHPEPPFDVNANSMRLEGRMEV